ncbi:TonB-dependent receptor [Sphingobacteriaceae bacterium WQ 2009]|uniref:TonB-dependent receptor n=1 Tax=Rhinopithecimicrobium faecis TaxID=2820698 RepID=A0A8T4HCH6_9SPHI|nr:TonB-dependent receptor [Sphingobacteriaceae bacterium WQ 2009]
MKNIGLIAILRWLVLIVCIFFWHKAQAQIQPKPIINASIQGQIIDANTKVGIPGVTVRLEAVTHSVRTDDQGHFSFITGQTLPAILHISSLGYESLQTTFNQGDFEILLKPELSNLEEVVVVGYGSQRRADIIGAVASVPKLVLNQSLSSFDQALKGAVAGVQVTQTSGQPGGGVSIRVRGGASIQGGNEPLYVIDGFPLYSEAQGTGVNAGASINPLAAFDMGEVEQIEILKDAAATAIYGSRGANGVILVTTKKGRAGPTQINYSNRFGQQQIARKIPLLNASEFALLRNEALFDSNPALGPFQYLSQEAIGDLGEGTNWQNEAFRKAGIQQQQLSLGGSSERIQYYLSGNYFLQDGILRNTDFDRLGMRANISVQATERLKIETNLAIQRTKSTIAPGGIINALLLMPPTATIYEQDGSYTLRNPFENIFSNPIASLLETINKTASTNIFGTSYAQYRLLKGLHAKVLFGLDAKSQNDSYYTPSSIYEGASNNGNAALGSRSYYSWLNENTLTYDVNWRNHHVDVLLGFTQQEARNEYFNAGAQNFVTDELTVHSLQSGSTLIRPNSDAYDWVLHSYLSRINYNYDNRYYLSASVRRDGSSRFGPNNKFGIFPSIALSWRASNESFFQQYLPGINDLKFRTSYGRTGNLEIGQYQSLATLNTLNYLIGGNILTGFTPQRLGNPTLGWETTTQYDLGFDIAFAKNKVQFSFDTYYKRTTDLLLNVEIPWTSGFSSALQNFGTVSNRGYEFQLRINPLSGSLQWTSDLNFSVNRNRVLALGNESESYIIGNYIVQVGQPLGTFYGAKTDGVLQLGEEQSQGVFTGNAEPAAGDRRYVDSNNDGLFNVASDRTIIGNAQPDFTIGFSNSLRYRNFELSFLLYASVGNEVINENNQNLEMFSGQQNASAAALDRWTPQNPSNEIPRAKLDPAPVFSDRYVEDASFLRLRSVELQYRFPVSVNRLLHIKQLSVQLSAQNLWTWTNYSGFDPEVTSGSNVQPGRDAGIYPIAKSFHAGVAITF